ncbi:MAG: hypothetical protein ABSB79_00960 [Syntrophales bacterium]|jgi:hypothetical protein
MNSIDFHQILKWVVIILVAGFIGQFGKHFATYLIERARKKKMNAVSEKASDTSEHAHDTTSEGDILQSNRANAKTDKKAMKTLMKLWKKDK